MRKIVLLVIALVFIMCNSVWALGKITVDPNAGINRTQAEEWSADARLSQKVTYEARHKAVKTILADLSEMTGITFNAGYNKKDWQVRDRKMNIFAKDITLADLMSSIARVMKFKWSINKDDVPWTYRIYMDRKTLVEANAELNDAQRKFDEQGDLARAKFLDKMENWSDDLSADELDDLKDKNAYLYMLHVSGVGAAVNSLLNDVPDLANNILSKGPDRSYPIAQLSPETQEAVLKAIKWRYQIKGEKYGGEGAPFPQDMEKAFTTGSMWFDVQPDELSWKAIQNRKFMGIGIWIGDRFFQMNPLIGAPNSPTNCASAYNLVNAVSENISLQESFRKNFGYAFSAWIEEEKMNEKIFPTENQPDVPDEPDLHMRIKYEPENSYLLVLADCEAAIAKASGFTVVSDSFKSTQGYAAIDRIDKTELKVDLDTIGEGYRYNWDKHGSIIEFRSKDWFRKRTVQIPDEWIDNWRDNLKKNGYMSLDDCAQIANLSTEQIIENIRGDKDFHKADLFDPYYSKQIWLMRLYASFNEDQKKQLFSEIGLNTLSFNADQWQMLHLFFQNQSFAVGTARAILKCSVDYKDKIPSYKFILSDTDSNVVLGTWIANMLKYEPPKSEPEPKKVEEKKADEKNVDDKQASAEKK